MAIFIWAHPRLRRGPGYPLQSFAACGRQKYFRFYPLRGIRAAHKNSINKSLSRRRGIMLTEVCKS
jgi:hypothetical protein